MSMANDDHIIKSPLKTLAEHDLQILDYKPDEFPGKRDIDTPFGSIRAYEFGPEDGPKVLLIHGINTACHSMAKLAQAAVHKGCRVMLFDLFGRGFSDTPSDLNHDIRLYLTQILLVLASSPLAWTGHQARIKLVGYSLGGSLAVHFAGAFPHMVESVFLVAPAGMIDPDRFGAMAAMAVKSPVPDALLRPAMKRILRSPLSSQGKKKNKGKGRAADEDAPDEAEDESVLCNLLGGAPGAAGLSLAQAEVIPAQKFGPSDQSLTARVGRYQRWMPEHSRGSLVAITSCTRHGPLCEQQKAFQRLAVLRKRTAFVFARNDDMALEPTFREHIRPMFHAQEDLMWRVVRGDHHLVSTHASEVVGPLLEFWGMT